MRDLWNFSFFGRGDVSPTHLELCRFVSESKAKHQASSPLIILLKNFVCFGYGDNVLVNVTQSSLCSGVKQCGTARAHNFLFPKSSFKIRRTTVLGVFKDSAIILDAIRPSFLTTSATAAVFNPVRVDFGRSRLSSSSASSLRSRNREYHLETFERFRASFP